MNYAGPPSDKPFMFGTPASRHMMIAFTVAAAAFMTAALLCGAGRGDRSGDGMVVLGLSMFAAPAVGIAGSLAFIFRRTAVIADCCGGAVLFLTVFFGTLYLMV